MLRTPFSRRPPPPPGDEPRSPALQVDSFPSEPPKKPENCSRCWEFSGGEKREMKPGSIPSSLHPMELVGDKKNKQNKQPRSVKC